MKARNRTCTFEAWKDGGIVTASFRAPELHTRAESHEPLARTRVFAVDTESLRSESTGGELRTVLVPVHFHDRSLAIATREGRGMMPALLSEIFAQEGYSTVEDRPSRTSVRRHRDRGGRDGRRETVEPVLSVWFNLPYDIGRLFADEPQNLRAVACGSDSYRFEVGGGAYEIEVARLVLGNASSFEWYVRRRDDARIVRLLGIDLTGYWKSSLAAAAKAAGVAAKIDVEKEVADAYERTIESLSAEEWEAFRAYSIGDTLSTLELYHRTVELLVRVDARVVRKTGVIPPSAPGASARVIFAKAFDCHPEIEAWRRYPAWADQMGLDAYAGARAFNRERGVFSRMGTVDLKSAYPLQMALLPDPVDVECVPVPAGPFNVDDWRGKYGVLYVSGEATDDVMPALRMHDPALGGRLRYVAGKFDNLPATIPEIVIGVLRGSIRVDRIVRTDARAWGGVELRGSAENSFLRRGIADFFAIKEDRANDEALRFMGKLFMNSGYGKLIEMQVADLLVAEEWRMPWFRSHAEIAHSVCRVYASSGRDLEPLYWGDGEAEERSALGFFHEAFADEVARGLPPLELQSQAVRCYVEALDAAEVDRDEARGAVRVGRYVQAYKDYRCGHYFMPVYAAQVTGVTSAMVGLMADCTGALQGDTDSVHVVVPPGVRNVADVEGFRRYFEVMRAAGYASPEASDPASLVPGLGKIGVWEEECKDLSIESVLVRPKLYSHMFVSSKSGDISYKQAKHGFAKFTTAEVERLVRDPSLSREDRRKRAEAKRADLLHRATKELLTSGHFEYATRSAPRRLKEAVTRGTEVGEFTSREMRMVLTRDPNTWTDEAGVTRWRELP